MFKSISKTGSAKHMEFYEHYIQVYDSNKCRLPESVAKVGESVEIEVDEESSAIRCKVSHKGTRVDKLGRTTFRISLANRIIKGKPSGKIELTLAEDGWWYGSYA